MRVVVFFMIAMVLCMCAAAAWAEPSDAELQALQDRSVDITMASGQTVHATIIGHSEGSVVISSNGELSEIDRAQISKVALGGPSAEMQRKERVESGSSATAHSDDLQRVGRPMRLGGGIMLGVGGLITFSTLVVMPFTGVTIKSRAAVGGRESEIHKELNRGVMIPFFIGLGMTLTGTALLVVANQHRRKARKAAPSDHNSATYSFAPLFYKDGGGAQMMLQF